MKQQEKHSLASSSSCGWLLVIDAAGNIALDKAIRIDFPSLMGEADGPQEAVKDSLPSPCREDNKQHTGPCTDGPQTEGRDMTTGLFGLGALVVINQDHDLFPEQIALLEKEFGKYDRINIPAEGLSLDRQRELARWMYDTGKVIVFASPVPALLNFLAHLDGEDGHHSVFVFHNDRRDKKELPGGKIIMTVAAEGWQLV